MLREAFGAPATILESSLPTSTLGGRRARVELAALRRPLRALGGRHSANHELARRHLLVDTVELRLMRLLLSLTRRLRHLHRVTTQAPGVVESAAGRTSGGNGDAVQRVVRIAGRLVPRGFTATRARELRRTKNSSPRGSSLNNRAERLRPLHSFGALESREGGTGTGNDQNGGGEAVRRCDGGLRVGWAWNTRLGRRRPAHAGLRLAKRAAPAIRIDAHGRQARRRPVHSLVRVETNGSQTSGWGHETPPQAPPSRTGRNGIQAGSASPAGGHRTGRGRI